MKKIVLVAALAMLGGGLYAQNTYETVDKWEKTQGACVAIKVNTDVKEAQKVMETLLKNEGLKGKSGGKKLSYDKTVFPKISTDYINLYIKFEATNKDKNAPVTTVFLFVSKGISTTFESSTTDSQLIGKLRRYIDENYSKAVYDQVIANKTAAKAKEIKSTNKEVSSLEKKVGNLEKENTKLEKSIEKAKSDIEKNKKDIENSKKQMETKKGLLQKQQTELEQIK